MSRRRMLFTVVTSICSDVVFWSRRRPPLHLREKVHEGQRLTDQSVELFMVRPAFNRPGEQIEQPIAKLQHVRSRKVWRIFWNRADGKYHGYEPSPQTDSLSAALRVIDALPGNTARSGLSTHPRPMYSALVLAYSIRMRLNKNLKALDTASCIRRRLA